MKTIIIAAFAFTMVSAGSVLAADNDTAVTADQAAAAHQMVSDVCSKCHGMDGNSPSALFPRLAGQTESYLENQLKQFRAHGRADPHAQAYMWGIAGPLNDIQIRALAAYFAAKPPMKADRTGDPALVAEGKKIFDNGVDSHNVPACKMCHGAVGQGNGEFPRLAGQHREYLYKQIQDFRNTLRASDIMHDNTKNMTNDEARAVVEYLTSK